MAAAVSAGELGELSPSPRPYVSNAIPRVLLQTPLQKRRERWRQTVRQRLPVRLRPNHVGERGRDVLAIEGTPARQHPVEHNAERRRPSCVSVACQTCPIPPSPMRAVTS